MLDEDTYLILVCTRVHSNQNGGKLFAKTTKEASGRLDSLMVKCVTSVGQSDSQEYQIAGGCNG